MTVLRGLYAGAAEPAAPRPADPVVLFAARLIPEKQVTLAVAAMALAAERVDGLRGEFLGEGPERAALDAAIVEHRLQGVVSARGFADTDVVDAEMRRATCMLLTSRREGYGLVVVEAAARGTPSVVRRRRGQRRDRADRRGRQRQDRRAALIRRRWRTRSCEVHEAGMALRESTARWFAEHAEQLSLESSLRKVLEIYAGDGARGVPPASDSLAPAARA